MNDDAFRLYAGKHGDGRSDSGPAVVAFCDVWWEKGVVGNAGPSAPAAPVPWEGAGWLQCSTLGKGLLHFLKTLT